MANRRKELLGISPPSAEITPESVYLRRRELIRGAAALAAASTLGLPRRARAEPGTLPATKKGPFPAGEPQTSFKDITSYNNFYEFGTDKSDPGQNAHTLRTRP